MDLHSLRANRIAKAKGIFKRAGYAGGGAVRPAGGGNAETGTGSPGPGAQPQMKRGGAATGQKAAARLDKPGRRRGREEGGALPAEPKKTRGGAPVGEVVQKVGAAVKRDWGKLFGGSKSEAADKDKSDPEGGPEVGNPGKYGSLHPANATADDPQGMKPFTSFDEKKRGGRTGRESGGRALGKATVRPARPEPEPEKRELSPEPEKKTPAPEPEKRGLSDFKMKRGGRTKKADGGSTGDDGFLRMNSPMKPKASAKPDSIEFSGEDLDRFDKGASEYADRDIKDSEYPNSGKILRAIARGASKSYDAESDQLRKGKSRETAADASAAIGAHERKQAGTGMGRKRERELSGER